MTVLHLTLIVLGIIWIWFVIRGFIKPYDDDLERIWVIATIIIIMTIIICILSITPWNYKIF